jgi:uncharacterized SAM-binding protein YcdF (DUF218 family)
MYALTKFVEFFLQPGNALVSFLTAGIALQWSRWPRIGLWMSTVSASLLLAILFLPIGDWLLMPLENAYPRPPWPRHVDGVLILGGALDPSVYLSRGVPSEDDVEGRFVAAAELLRRYPNARLIFSGGSGAILANEAPEADAARLAIDQLGIDQKRVSYENRSRNTWENIVYSRALARPHKGDVWVLATSASQLPRAMAAARRLDWNLVPWASDYKTVEDESFTFAPDFASHLETLDIALHEWLGLTGYWLAGRARFA